MRGNGMTVHIEFEREEAGEEADKKHFLILENVSVYYISTILFLELLVYIISSLMKERD